MKKTIWSIVISLLGLLSLWIGTDGLHAYTSEGARRYAVEQHPRQLPDVLLQDQNGKTFSLSSLQGKHVLFTFFYASCGDVCPELETQFKQVVEGIPDVYRGRDITFLSISFDPARDDPEVLREYSKFLNADGVDWKVVTVPDKQQLNRLLQVCDVVVLPDKDGEYQHNAAIYDADRNLRLDHIYDYNIPKNVVQKVTTQLSSS